MGDMSPGFPFLVAFMLVFYLLPTIIAYRRKHAYWHVIFALNVIGGVTGVGWIVAIIWAVWPADKSLADPVLGNVTGMGSRNVGDTLGAVSFGQVRGYQEERAAHERKLPQA